MAHEVENMFSVKERPWHGLGEIIADAPSTAEGIKLAGLDWGVSCHPLYTSDNVEVDARAVRRDTDGSVLGVVGPRWSPLQNVEAFKFFDPFIETGECSLETAGSLRGGARVFVTAKINRPNAEVRKGDEVAPYFVLTNGHDGKLAVRVGFSVIRIVCANTLRACHNDDKSKLLRVRHHAGVVASLDKIRETISMVDAEFRATADQYRFLASRAFNQADVTKYVKVLLGVDPKKTDADLSTKTKNILSKVFNLVYAGTGTGQGTWWDAYNGVTEYLSHHACRNADNRYDSLWMGINGGLNQQALQTATDYANAV